jgi:hypothetical protein
LVEKDPFLGLASARPVRALAALNRAARSGNYPERSWRTFLSSTARKDDKPKFSAFIAERASRLPSDAIGEFVYQTCEWLLGASKNLFSSFPDSFERICEKLISVLALKPEKASSGIVRGDKEPDWVMEAINSPSGRLAEALMNDPKKDGLAAGQQFPSPWIQHVEALLQLPGDLRRYAVVIFSFNLVWFYAIEPDWAEKNLISIIDHDRTHQNDDENAFWAGFFWGARVPTLKLYVRLKSHFLRLARENSSKEHSHSEILAGILLSGWKGIDPESGLRIVTNNEMRDVLINSDESLRSQVLWQLERWCISADGGQEWKQELPEFLSDVWPRHKKAKSAQISARLCHLAFSSEEIFPKVVDLILPLITSIGQRHIFLPSLADAQRNIVERFPEKTLALLSAALPDTVSTWPYGIDQTLDRIGVVSPSLLNDSRLTELKRKWNAR